MPANDTPLVAARRARLRKWIDDHFAGRQVDFFTQYKMNQGLTSGILKGGKSFGEKIAAKIEAKVSEMPAGYLVKALDPPGDSHLSQAAGIDLEILTSALVAVKEAVNSEDVEIDLFKIAPVIALAYRERTKLPGKPTKTQLRHFDEVLRTRLREGLADGEWEGRVARTSETSTQGSASKAAKAGRRQE